ncbi:hypothetical protein T4B_1361 [Trichinella pseudospiralis]|uniref:Uncharacterized protein n=1 Tax=Trichinella pseudospiralis TaxID=6337 RepID=A0A0V1KEY5_TRIPS|nr:hypothetical protein T4A_8628 [Trichinella pseudospiralis]KRZ32475.1 hypothetical protein T4B_1361 [Trichinella pseudospiralis]KRZ45598.1 hypothetical protein T4C_10724 [Trichinella pseudospiralis]
MSIILQQWFALWIFNSENTDKCNSFQSLSQLLIKRSKPILKLRFLKYAFLHELSSDEIF